MNPSSPPTVLLFLLLMGLGGFLLPYPGLAALAHEQGGAQQTAQMPAQPQTIPAPRPHLRPEMACPQDIETLTALLVRDIPGYLNRVLQRHLGAVRQASEQVPLARYRPAYAIAAGRLELEPLAVADHVYTTSAAAGDPLHQVFFTTLERQYAQQQVTETLQFHWLFLAPTETGWYLALMFSTVGNRTWDTPILPPYESSHGSTGQAVQLWLRDCRAGAIAPAD